MAAIWRALFAGCIAVLLTSGCASTLWRDTGRNTLWVITDEDNTVYLLGSVHVMPRAAHPFTRTVNDAFEASEDVVFEIDLSRSSSDTIAQELEKEGTYPPGDSLEAHLSEAGEEVLRALLPAFGLEFDEVNRYRPWFLADAMMARFLYERGIRAEYGVDDHFFVRAKRGGKRISGLETVSAQAGIYKGLTDREAEDYLIGTVLSLPEIEHTILHISQSWKAGRTAELDALLNAHAVRNPKISERMFARRNRAWLPRIETSIAGDKDTIYIVGAGHLVGRKGIVHSLRQKGHAIKQR